MVLDKPPRYDRIRRNSQKIQNSLEIRPAKSLNRSKGDKGKSIKEKSQRDKLQNYRAVHREFGTEPKTHDISCKKHEYRSRRRKEEEKIFECSRGHFRDFRALASTVITEVGKQRGHNTHGKDQKLGDKLIGRGVKGEHADGEERGNHKTLEISEDRPGDVGDHNPAAKDRQWSERSTGNTKVISQIRNG